MLTGTFLYLLNDNDKDYLNKTALEWEASFHFTTAMAISRIVLGMVLSNLLYVTLLEQGIWTTSPPFTPQPVCDSENSFLTSENNGFMRYMRIHKQNEKACNTFSYLLVAEKPSCFFVA